MTIHHSQSQAHGFEFEDNIKSLFYPKSKTSYLSLWDVEKEDNNDAVPVSIKTSKNNVIYLSGSIGFFSIDEKFQMFFLKYKQVGDYKEPVECTRFTITPEEKKQLIGEYTLDIVTEFHNGLKTFPLGDHEAARLYGKEMNESLEAKYNSCIKLNPKVGNKDNQRRLQCSVQYETLFSIVKNKVVTKAVGGFIKIDGKKLGSIYAPPRERKSTDDESFKVIEGGKKDVVSKTAQSINTQKSKKAFA